MHHQTTLYTPALHEERVRTAAERGLVQGAIAALREVAAQLRLAVLNGNNTTLAAACRQLAREAAGIARRCLSLVDLWSGSNLPPTREERLAWRSDLELLHVAASELKRALLALLSKLRRLDWTDDTVWLARMPRGKGAA